MPPPGADPSDPGAWATIREALHGSRQDFTEGPVGRAVVLLAVPMILEMALESVFAVVDVFWVSKLGAGAIATIGLTESMLAIVYAVAIGLSMSTGAMVARRIGEKDPERASRTALQAIGLGIFVGLAIGIPAAMNARRLLALMGAGPDVIAAGGGFATIMLGGNVVIVLLFLINASFRGAGDAAIAMRVLWIANIVNLVLDPCLIFGLGPFPKLGVTGAAVATTTGRGIAVVIQLVILFRGKGRISIGRRSFRFDFDAIRTLLRLAGHGVLQNVVGTASWTVLVRILSGFGSAAVAGYTIGIRIIIFALLPSWGMSNAAATMVGQSLGAKKPERAERAVWMAALYNVIFLGAVGILFVVLAGPLVRLFTDDPAILPYAADCLRIVSYGFVFFAYGMVMIQAFNGAGDTWTPTVINFFCFWVFEIPVAWFLAERAGLGPRGVFLAITAAFSTLAVVGVTLFRRGKWKTKIV